MQPCSRRTCSSSSWCDARPVPARAAPSLGCAQRPCRSRMFGFASRRTRHGVGSLRKRAVLPLGRARPQARRPWHGPSVGALSFLAGCIWGRFGMQDVLRPLSQSGLPQGLPRSRSLEESGWQRRDGRSSGRAMATGGELATRALVSGWVEPITCFVNLPALWSGSRGMRDVGWPCGTARALGGPADDG